MALMAPVIPQKQLKKGGGGFGKLVGLLAGGAIGAATGGAGLAAAGAALSGAATGAGVGGMVGEALSPAEQARQVAQANALERKQKALDADPMRALREAQTALPELPQDMQAQLQEPLRLAMERVKGQR
jgi:hypothetical protein